MTAPQNVHATGIVLDGAGVMLCGPSGAGKSLLALQLLDQWAARGSGAALVADDRLDLTVEDGGLVMRAPATIAGKIELRGRGIVNRDYVEAAPVDLVVDLVDSLERMPEPGALRAEIAGVTLPRCPVPRLGIIDSSHQAILVREALAALPQRQKTLE